jgi:hypothetical protein
MLRLGIKDKTRRKQDDHGNEHIGPLPPYAQSAQAKPGHGTDQGPQEQKDLEQILHGHVTCMYPAEDIPNQGRQKAEGK